MITRWETSHGLVSQPMMVSVVEVNFQRFELCSLFKVLPNHMEKAVIWGCLSPEFR